MPKGDIKKFRQAAKAAKLTTEELYKFSKFLHTAKEVHKVKEIGDFTKLVLMAKSAKNFKETFFFSFLINFEKEI